MQIKKLQMEGFWNLIEMSAPRVSRDSLPEQCLGLIVIEGSPSDNIIDALHAGMFFIYACSDRSPKPPLQSYHIH